MPAAPGFVPPPPNPKMDPNDPKCKSADDPCKALGCSLQQCYMDMQQLLTRQSHAINDKGWCAEEKALLKQCREEHGLPTFGK